MQMKEFSFGSDENWRFFLWGRDRGRGCKVTGLITCFSLSVVDLHHLLRW